MSQEITFSKIDGYLIDMDGTIYLGKNLIPGADRFVKALQEKGKNFLFLTNNSSPSLDHYRKKLGEMGMEIPEEQILTSGEVALRYLQEKGLERIFPVGTPDLENLLSRGGRILTPEKPQMVLLGFDTTLTYDKLSRACLLIQRGVPWMATHPDEVCPTENGFIPDCGAMMALIERATNIPPAVVLGKPSPYMASQALGKLSTPAHKTLMIGDRLYTDVRMGQTAGMKTLLVLSGETTKEDLEKSGEKPDFVFLSLADCVDLV